MRTLNQRIDLERIRMQLTKAYVAETSCSQLSLIESATYMLKVNSVVIKHVAVSLYNIIDLSLSLVQSPPPDPP